MLVCARWHFKYRPILLFELLSNWHLYLFECLKVDTDLGKFSQVALVSVIEHIMVDGICEDETLNSLEELFLMFFKQGSRASTSCWMGHDWQCLGRTFWLCDEVLPYILCVLYHWGAVLNWLICKWVLCHVWVKNYDWLTCLNGKLNHR